MRHNIRRRLELSSFLILTEILSGSLSGFLLKIVKLHFINTLHWTSSHSGRLKERKSGQDQHHFLSPLFVFKYFHRDSVLKE